MANEQDTGIKVERTGAAPEPTNLWAVIERKAHDLYPRQADQVSLLMTLAKAVLEPGPANTNAPLAPGMKNHPFDFEAAARLKILNVHHSTCIAAMKMSMAGLGHEDEKVAKALNVLCPRGRPWLTLLLQVMEDYAQFGNGYIEVVRGEGGVIAGLHHLPARDVRFVLEENSIDGHWSIRGGSLDGSLNQTATVMAKFGDLDLFVERNGPLLGDRRVSEVIHFIDPSSANRFYGMPDWLAGVASMELVQALHQHQFDFHVNRGVPEFLLFLTGGKVDSKTWNSLKTAMQSHVGVTNSHRSSMFNLTDPDIEVHVEQMAMAGIEDGVFFQSMSETLSVNIVSAHRTPPSLAGILIPGKMGASNETSNAVMMYQALKIGPAQTIVEQILDATLGDPLLNGGLELAAGDFALKTIVDEMAENMSKLAPVKTMGGMKQEMPDAAAEGRDLNAGLKK